MLERYRNGLIKSIKEDSGAVPNPALGEISEWHARIIRCAKRVLTAICFRESSYSIYSDTQSIVLPSIGYYYSTFHMGVAMLCVEYTTPLENLVQLRHERLYNLLNSKLVNRHFISEKYLDVH